MANRIQLRRDGAQQWANVNPILAQGELGIEIDTSRIKIGDGVTAWNSLKYERPLETESNTANTLVKRDADGNFEAGAITASLIGNAATATRLANARQIALGGDMSGSGTFDGSSNLTITAELNYVTALPHYDEENLGATGTYTRITVDSRGRIVNADNPSTLADFGIGDAQPLDSDLTSLANMTGFGFVSRQAEGTLVNRTITGGSGRIVVQNGNAQTSNPFVDLADTTVVVGKYNPISAMDPLVDPLISATTGEETVNTVNFQVDRYGRLIYANTSPIATAREGAKDGTSFTVYDNATAYPRFSKIIASNGRVYQAAIRDIPAGLGEPTHNTQQGDTDDQGGWRDLGTDKVEQKGVASFDQEDFDVDDNGHVTIAERAIENSQLQSRGLLMFTDQNATETFELDPERTTDNAYHGITTINHVNVNNRGGDSVFRVVGYDTAEYPFQPGILAQGNSYPAVAADDPNGNGSADWGSIFTGLVDLNLDATIAGNITLDVTKTNQFIKRTSGNVDFHLEVNEAADRNMNITANNADPAGTANINITADNEITITSTNAAYFVNVEDYRFQQNVLSTRNSTMVLDPGDDDAATGLVQIRGDLQVDGVTTTVNSVVMTVQDPIITLGGEDTLVADDNKDRGIEFRYYDSQERFGFFGWDEDYADSNIWNGTGGYRFLYNATNTNEVFAGTDAAIIAGNLRLTTNTGSTWKTPTTGTLVVTGGVGISENLNVGGTTHILGNVEIDGTVDIDANFAVRNNTTDKFTVESATGNTVIEGTVDIQLETEITDNLIISADNKEFIIRTAGLVNKFTVDTDNGNTDIQGTVHVVGAVDFDSTLNVDSDVTFNATLDVDGNSVFHNNVTLDVTGKYFTITNGTDQKFRVLSTNGNTDIEGSLNIGGFNTFERTNNIVVDATSSESDISLTTQGNATFAGGVNIEKDVRIATDLYVADRIVVKDAGTARTRPSLLNNVDILYRQVVGATTAHNSTYATDAAANLRITGGVGIGQDLHIGDDLYIGKLNINDTVEFSVLGESGYTTIGRVGQGNATDGALVVHGDATFNREFNITGYNTTIGDSATDVLTVNAVSTFTDNVTVNGDLEVDQNVIINQNLTVHGTTTTVNSTVVTLDDPIITLGGDTAPASNDGKDRGVEFRYYSGGAARIGFYGWDDSAQRYAFYNAATNASEVFTGTRSGIDAGSLKLFDTTNSTSASTGTLIVGGGVGIGLDLYVGDDLNVTDDVTVGGNIAATGAITTQSNFQVQTVFSVTAGTGNTYIGGTLQVNGNSTIGNAGSDSHTVNGTVLFNHAITSTDITADNIKIGVDGSSEISTTSGNLILDSAGGTVNVTDNLDVDLDLNVDGNTKIDGTLTVDGNTTIGNAGTDAHTVTGTVQFNQALTGAERANIRDIKIGTDAANEIGTLAGNLILDSFAGKVHVTDNMEVDGFLQVDGNTTLGDASSDTLTVNATSTFTAPITSTDITADNIKIGVDGSSQINTTAGNLVLDAATNIVNVAATLDVDNNLIVDGNSTLGNASSDTLTVNATSSFTAPITSTDITADQVKIGVDAANEISTTSGNLILDSAGGTVNITDNADVDGNLNVDGNTQLVGTLAVNGNATIGNAGTDAHVVNGTVTFNHSITSTNITADSIKIGVDGDREISTTTGNLVLDSAGGTVNVTDNMTVSGTLGVNGNTTIGNAGTDAHTFNGTVTFNQAITSTDITADSVKIGVDGSSEISTTAGNLILDSAGGEVSVDDNLSVTGTSYSAGQLTVGNSILLNASNQQFRVRSLLVDRFTIDSDNGNTFIGGTLNVEGASVIDDTLNVTGATSLDSTLTVDGITRIDNTTNTTSLPALFTPSGALRVAGGASFAGNVAFGGDIQIYGDFTVDGNQVSKGNQEFSGRVEFSKNETPTRLIANAPIMVTNGGITVYEDSFFGEDIFIGPDQGTTISLFGATGNITATGTVSAATFSGVTGNISTINTTSNVNVGGSIIVQTNKFIVAGATGNTDIAGTLDVAGRTIIDDTFNVTGAVDLDSTLNVDGASTFNNTITQNSTTRFNDNVVLQGASKTLQLNNGSGTTKIELQSTTGNITAGGLTTTNTLAVTSNSTIGGTLGVTGQITGNVTGDLTGTADKSNLVNITETATSNLTYYVPFVSTNTGYTEVRTDSQNLTYNPSTNTLTVNNFKSVTDFEIQGNLNVTGTITFFNSQVGSIANHDTDALAEGVSNLYFTDERVDDRVAALVQGGTGISAVYNDAGNLLNLEVDFGEINTDNLTEGVSNLFTTADRTRSHFTYGTGIQLVGADLSIAFNEFNTDSIVEGSSNIFFTQSRARGSFSASGDLSYNASTGDFSVTTFKTADARNSVSASGDLAYNASTGVFSFTERTNAEVRALISASGDVSYNSTTGVISYTTPSTSGITEGTNLYFTNERVDDRVAALISGGTGISASYDDAGNLLTLSAVPADINTDNLTEGSTNLFTTAARTRSHISASGDISYNSTTGVFSYTAPTYATVASTGAYSDLSGTPVLATVATSGSYNDLSNLPTLGTAAATNSTAYATAAQGTLADSAVQPGDLATVATSGSYNDLLNLPTLFSGAYADLTGKPTLGTAAATDSTAYATAAQGSTADANNTDIDDIYTALNAIGNDAGITTVAQLKAALAALTR